MYVTFLFPSTYVLMEHHTSTHYASIITIFLHISYNLFTLSGQLFLSSAFPLKLKPPLQNLSSKPPLSVWVLGKELLAIRSTQSFAHYFGVTTRSYRSKNTATLSAMDLSAQPAAELFSIQIYKAEVYVLWDNCGWRHIGNLTEFEEGRDLTLCLGIINISLKVGKEEAA